MQRAAIQPLERNVRRESRQIDLVLTILMFMRTLHEDLTVLSSGSFLVEFGTIRGLLSPLTSRLNAHAIHVAADTEFRLAWCMCHVSVTRARHELVYLSLMTAHKSTCFAHDPIRK